MNSKELIIKTTISLISENKDDIDKITMREISKEAGVGLGLINYHFENKDKLIEVCVEKIVNSIIEKFHTFVEITKDCTPFEKLNYLGNLTFTFLFENEAISKISMLSDMKCAKETDNTHRTIEAYIPLIKECRPDWNFEKVQQASFNLISAMQLAFLRHEIIFKIQGINLKDQNQRKKFHTKILKSILEINDKKGDFNENNSY